MRVKIVLISIPHEVMKKDTAVFIITSLEKLYKSDYIHVVDIYLRSKRKRQNRANVQWVKQRYSLKFNVRG